MIQRSLSLSLLCLGTCLLLQGCSSVKKSLGIERDAPNEYDVTPSAQPLEMPPDFFHLPPPAPGMERPQERTARQTQEAKILGAAQQKEAASAGQQHLLEMSGATANQESIRSEIDTAARIEPDKGEKTIVESLGLKKSKPQGDAVNPYEEAARLKEQQVSRSPSATQHIVPSAKKRHAQRTREERKGKQLRQDAKPLWDVLNPEE